MHGFIPRFSVVFSLLVLLVCNRLPAQPLCHGSDGPLSLSDLPDAVREIMSKDPTAYQFKRAYINQVKRLKRNRQLVQSGLVPEGDGGGAGALQVVVDGARQVPVFLGKFSNSAAADPFTAEVLQQKLFDGPSPTGTMTEYYDEISYEKLQVGGTVYAWVETSQNDTYYEGTNQGTDPDTDRTDEFVTEILTANDAAVDFSQFDNDGPDGVPNSGDDDGYVDFIAVVHPEIAGECIGNNTNLWSHRWTLSSWGSSFTTNDPGVGGGFIQVDDYTLMPGLECGGGVIEIGVFCHEFGHAFGLPDLYDTRDSDGDSEGLGHWCLMAAGNWNTTTHPAHMSAWAKAELGWLIPTVVTEDLLSWPIHSASVSPTAFKLWADGTPGSEYFLVENRTRSGFDDQLAGEGLLIYHIDEGQSGDKNKDETHKLIDLECQDQTGDDHVADTDDLDAETNRGDSGDPFCTNDFNSSSTPSSVSYSGTLTGVAVRNITGCGSLEVIADLIVGSSTTDRVDLCMRDCGGDVCNEPSVPPCSNWWGSPDIYIDNNGDGIIDPPAEGLTNKLKVRVRNVGTSSASNVEVGFYFADPTLGLLFPSTGTLIDTDDIPIVGSGGTGLAEVDWVIPKPPPAINHWCIGVIASHSDDEQIDEYPPEDNNVAQINMQELYKKAGDAVPAGGAGAGGLVEPGIFTDEKIFRLCNPLGEGSVFVVRLGSPPDYDDAELPEGWSYEAAVIDEVGAIEPIDLSDNRFQISEGGCLELILTVRKENAFHTDRAVIPLTLTDGPFPDRPVGGAVISYEIDNVVPRTPTGCSAIIEARGDNNPGEGAVRISWSDHFNDVLGFPDRTERWRIYQGRSEDFSCNERTLLIETAIDEDPSTVQYDHFADIPPQPETWYKIIAVDRAGNESGTCLFPLRRPNNDLCEDAEALGLSQDVLAVSVDGTTAEYATPDGESADCGSSNAPGLWYSVTGLGETMSAALCGSAYDTKISVFSGNCGALTCVAENDDSCGLQSMVNWVPEEGSTYFVLVHGFGSSSGDFTLTVEAVFAMQDNDDCDGATELDLAAGQAVVAASTASAATVDAESADCGASNAPGLWYSAVGNGGPMSATTCHADTNYDTRLSVFSGGCGALVCVVNNDDSCDISGTRSTVNWDSEFGVTYFILVHGYSTRVGDFTLVVDQTAPPAEICDNGIDDDLDGTADCDDDDCDDADNCEQDGVGPFQRGDSNGDSAVDISDGVNTLGFLFLGVQDPPCLAAADANGDGQVNISDATYTLVFLFAGGADHPEPSACGYSDNPADEDMGCETATCN